MKRFYVAKTIILFTLYLFANQMVKAQVNDNFESGNLSSSWFKVGGSYSTLDVQTSVVRNGSYALELTGSTASNSQHYLGLTYPFTAATPNKYKYSVQRVSTTHNSPTYFVVTSGSKILCLAYLSGTQFTVTNANSNVVTKSINNNTWYDIEISDIDWTNKHFDIYVNDTLLKADFPFRDNTITSVDRVWIYNLGTSASTAYYDDISIGEEKPEITVIGNGLNIAKGDSTPSSQDFTFLGAAPTNKGSLLRQFSIQNIGVDTLVLFGNSLVSITGSTQFTVNSQPSDTILPGASSNFTLKFTPTSNGNDSAIVSITSNDTVNSPFTFKIKGTGATSGVNALHFDGSNDYVSINDVAQGMTGVTTWTLEAWIKTTGNQNGNDHIISAHTATGSNDLMLFRMDDGDLEIYDGNSSNEVNNNAIDDGDWHHVAITYNNTIGKLYIDGVLKQTDKLRPIEFSNDDRWVIGQQFDGTTPKDFWEGGINEIRIWKSVRTPQQIANHRFCEISNPANETDLVAYYTFNHGTAKSTNTGLTTLFDFSANGYHGTLTNFALTGSTSNFIGAPNVSSNCTAIDVEVCDANSYTGPGSVQYDSTGLYVYVTNSDTTYINLNLGYTALNVDELADVHYCDSGTYQQEFTTNLVSPMVFSKSNNDWVAINGIADSLAGSNRSVFMWMKAAGQVSGDNQILMSINPSGSGYVTNLGINKSNQELFIYDGGNFRNSGVTVTDAAWYFVGYTYNESTKKTIIYVDGVEATDFTNSQTAAADNRISLGQSFDGNNLTNFFDGLMAEVSIWNEVLDSAEIAEIMVASITGNHGKYTNLVAYYTGAGICNDNLHILNDYSGNGFNGSAMATSIISRDTVVAINGFDASSSYNFSLTKDGSSVSATNNLNITSAGSYVATLSRAHVNITDSFTISTTPSPTAAIDQGTHAYYASGDSVQLTNSSNSGVSYEWLKKESSFSLLGSAGFSSGAVNYTDVAIDGNNVPYVAIEDLSKSGKATVYKFNGSTWALVGSAGFTPDVASYISLAFDQNNVPYVAYTDKDNALKASVMKYNGTNWVQVGSAGFTPDRGLEISLAFDQNNVPYIGYKDYSKSSKASVMKFDGSNWINVGTAGFSAGGATYPTLGIDQNNTLYFSFRDAANSSKLSVMKYNGTSWVLVGSAGFTPGQAYGELAIDQNNIPYVAFRDGDNSNKASVMKFNGTSWVQVGSAGFSHSSVGIDEMSFAIDNNNTPYFAYNESTSPRKAFLMKFNGTSWEQVGSGGFSSGMALKFSMAIDQKNRPIVAYYDDNVQKASATIYNDFSAFGTDTSVYAADSGVYVLKATNSAGCTAYDTILVDSIPPMTIATITGDSMVCYGETTTLSTQISYGAQPFTYKWSNNETIQNITVGAGTYTVTVTDQVYRDTTATFTVGQYADITPSITQGSRTFVAANDSVQLSVNAISGVNYQWLTPGTGKLETVGSHGFSDSTGYNPYIAISGSGMPYVLFRDMANSAKATVMKYNGTSWVAVGSKGFSPKAFSADNPLAIDGNGTPYVAYRDNANSLKATVMKFNGTSWVAVGSAGFTSAGVQNVSVAIDNNNTPYVVFQDEDNTFKATVMKYDGSGWVTVGSAGFSSGSITNNSLAIDDNGTPYVAFRDGADSTKATVMKFDGTNWSIVGSSGFSEKAINRISMSLDNNGMPYVAYTNVNSSNALNIKKFDGTTWKSVGGSIPESGLFAEISLAIDADNNPYLGYAHLFSSTGNILKFDGTTWNVVDSAGVSSDQQISLALDANGAPYVAYNDAANSGRVSVKKIAQFAVVDTMASTYVSDTGLYIISVTNAAGCVAYDTIQVDSGAVSNSEILVHGNGIEISSGSTTIASSNNTDFGSVDTNSTAVTKTFYIKNTGTEALTLNGTSLVALSGTNASEFSVSTQPSSSISAGDSSAFVLSFYPTTAGAKTATVTIANNDNDEGTYTFAIGGQGDSVVNTFRIDQIAVNNNPSCKSSTDGKITASVSGGTAPYTYAWSGSSVTDSFLTNLGAGTYSLTVTDAASNSATKSVTLTEPALLAATAVVDSNASCFGAADGGATASASGGTAPYSYAWSNNGSTATTNGLDSGIYTVLITDNNGCTASDTVTITEPSEIVTSNAKILPDCGSSNGSIDITVSGGASPYTYSWSNSATTQDLSSIAAGSYTVTITDNNGCSTNKTFSVSNVNGATASSVATSPSCYGSSNGSLNVTTTGSNTPFSFSWSNSKTTEDITDLSAGIYTLTITDNIGWITVLIDTVEQPAQLNLSYVVDSNVSCNGLSDGGVSAIVSGGTTPFTYAWANNTTFSSIAGMSAGTYKVVVTDKNGCKDSTNATITEPTALSASAQVTKNVTCNGLANGKALSIATGGTSPYAYAWSNSATIANITGAMAGTYSVTITDQNGCSDTANVTITEPNVLVATAVVDSHSVKGPNTGGATASAIGGTSPYTYSWSNSATTASTTALDSGTYVVTITDANGCSDKDTVQILSRATISFSIGSHVSCNGLANGQVTASITGGTQPYVYFWAHGDSTLLADSLAAGTYYFTAIDAMQDTVMDSITITEPAVLTASTTVDSNATCYGLNNGGATVTATGGTSSYNYVWSNSATSASIQGVAAGTYTVTITDAKGCVATSSTNITQPDSVAMTLTVDSNVSCNGLSNGGATASISGGTAPYSYNWSNSATTASITGVSAGTYTLTLTDANGCSNNRATIITEPATLVATTTVDSNVTCNGFSTGVASVTAAGGTAPYTYAWSNSATTTRIAKLPAATYSVTITDANNCTATNTATVTEPTLLVAGAIDGDTTICAGVIPNKLRQTTATSGGVGNYTYQWQQSTDSTTWSNIANATAATYQPGAIKGEYWFRRLDSDGNSCGPDTTNVLKVGVYAQPDAGFEVAVSCESEKTQFKDTTVLAFGKIRSYLWSFGDKGNSNQQNPINVYKASGTYTVTLKVIADGGCNSSVTRTISVNPMPKVDFTATAECKGVATNFTNKSSVTSGTMTYAWDLGDNNTSTATEPNHTYVNSGYYTVKLTATTNAGCVDSTKNTVQVKRIPKPNFSATSVCEGNNTVFTNLSTNGSTYSWDFGNSTGTSTKANPSYKYAKSGTYTAILTATSADGCSDTAQKQVTVYALPTAGFSATEECYGDATDFTNSSTGASSYQWVFGDGTSSNKQTPSVVYGKAGNYTVELTATTSNGCTDQTTGTVTVNALPQVSFTTSDVCQSDALTTTNNTTGATSYAWSFGDGNTSTQTAPANNYNTHGQYEVKLVATSAKGCVDSSSTTINAWAEPQVRFNANNVCLGNAMQFTNSSSIAKGTLTYQWDMGDNSKTGNASPSHTYQMFGAYGVKLVATSNRGCSDSSSKNVVVYNVPTMAFDAPNVCFADTFKTTNKSQVASTYEWSLGDGKTSSATDTINIYGKAGDYTVELTGTTVDGCKASLSKVVTIYAKPIAEFTAADVCDEEVVQFANASYNANITSHGWSFGDGNISTRINPTHTYATYGSYDVTLLVMTNDGCSDTLTQTATVHPNPRVSFTNTTECDYDTTDFTNTTKIASGSNSYAWDFGNGQTSTDASPRHFYQNAGIYKVSLEATSDKGCFSESTGLVTVNASPVAGVLLSNHCEETSTTIISNSMVSKGKIVGYDWKMGDGNTSNSQNPVYTYGKEGVYQVELIVTTDQACVDTATGVIEVYNKPVADFSTPDICFKEVSQFTDGSDDAQDYLYSFGDKWGISTVANPAYTYLAPGSYDATLYVTSSNGCRDTVTKTITIHGLPTARFDVNHHCFGEDFTPQDKSTGNPSTWNWSFADGNTSNDQNPTHNYGKANDYSVKLEVIDANNCIDSARKLVQVWPLPQPDIRPDTVVSKGYEVQLWAKGGVAYKWSPAELLDKPLQADPVAIVLEEQVYTVTVANEFGCTRDTFVTLRAEEDYTLEPSNIMTPDGNGQNDAWIVEKAQYYNNVEVIVFDRWGRIVYQSNSYDNSWEGTSTTGEPLPDGAYYYVVKVPVEREEYKGSITIFR